VPLVVLAALIPGVIELIRRRDERGFVLLRVLAVLLLVSYSVMAAKFMRYALPILAVIDLIAAVGAVSGMSWVSRRLRPSEVGSRFARVAVPAMALAALSVVNLSVAPFYSSFQNVVGSHLAPPGLTFPEETYDYGIREAVAVIARSAPAHAVIVSDAPGVVSHYLLNSGRSDLRVRSLSREGLPGGTGESWVIVQDEHMSFENQLVVRQLRRQGKPWREFRARETLAAQIFRIGAKSCCVTL
jgi:hypothetical protein